ncbi:hypothetical protein [Mycolicibacterium sphagni]|uniref:hypothetical protein n=1 Tax=Mycolicibacterium sphagni TaxID=1786 RepID=UPI0010555FE1|nr:hypothetical protein [Mycolicibacterium sphagni]
MTNAVTVAPTSPESPAAQPPSAPENPDTGVRSQLINVTLPPGTVPECCAKIASLETWTTPATYEYTVQSLREQLPLFKDYDGLPWCSQQINAQDGYTMWDWADDKQSIIVNIKQGEISINRGPDDQGRSSCDTG